MQKLRFLIDIDGVAANFIDLYMEVLNELQGSDHKHDEVVTWEIWQSLGHPKDVDREVLRRISEAEGACLRIQPYPGAAEGIARLRELVDLYAVTSPMPGRYWPGERNEWLYKHLGFAFDKVISTPAKHCVAGDFLLEDKTSALKKWKLHHPMGCAILWNHNTNRNDEFEISPPHSLRAASWDELIEFVRHMDAAHYRGLRHWTHL